MEVWNYWIFDRLSSDIKAIIMGFVGDATRLRLYESYQMIKWGTKLSEYQWVEAAAAEGIDLAREGDYAWTVVRKMFRYPEDMDGAFYHRYKEHRELLKLWPLRFPPMRTVPETVLQALSRERTLLRRIIEEPLLRHIGFELSFFGDPKSLELIASEQAIALLAAGEVPLSTMAHYPPGMLQEIMSSSEGHRRRMWPGSGKRSSAYRELIKNRWKHPIQAQLYATKEGFKIFKIFRFWADAAKKTTSKASKATKKASKSTEQCFDPWEVDHNTIMFLLEERVMALKVLQKEDFPVAEYMKALRRKRDIPFLQALISAPDA